MRAVYAASALALTALANSCGPKPAGAAEHDPHDAHGAPAAHASAATHGAADAHGAAAQHAPAHGEAAHHDAAATVHWTYGDQHAWARIAGQNSVCDSGMAQSPINLASAAPVAEAPDLRTHYTGGEGAFVNNGHTLQFSPSTLSTLTIGQDAYSLAQFHFHSPSEHTIDRMYYPVELHLVHRNSAGRLAVVGVFIEEGAANPALDALIAAMPHGQGEEAASHPNLDPEMLLPADRTFYAYAGSLTTPPCTEGVRWNVLRAPISASPEQIAALREALGASSRHAQPLNGRTVLLGL